MHFKDPLVLILIPVVLGVVYLFRRRQRAISFRFPSQKLLLSLPMSWKVKLRQIPLILRIMILILFIVALAGPRSVLEETQTKTEGIDIVLSLDSSGSMAAEDFRIDGKRSNRLAIVKKVVKAFVKERNFDRIGLVTFASLAYTVCPLTTDHQWLVKNLERIELGMIQDGTAVGSAIVSSLSRLKSSEAKSRVIILLTDGMNNAGQIDPISAARAAEALGIKIYTIGAGTKGQVPFPTTDMFGRQFYRKVRIDLDEKTLKEIADITGGKYFQASDTESLRDIYQQIDALEKTEIEELGYREYKELFSYFLILALLILCAELLLTNTIFFKIP